MQIVEMGLVKNKSYGRLGTVEDLGKQRVGARLGQDCQRGQKKNRPQDAMVPAGTLQKPWENKGSLQGRRRKSKGLLGATLEILRKMETLQKPW